MKISRTFAIGGNVGSLAIHAYSMGVFPRANFLVGVFFFPTTWALWMAFALSRNVIEDETREANFDGGEPRGDGMSNLEERDVVRSCAALEFEVHCLSRKKFCCDVFFGDFAILAASLQDRCRGRVDLGQKFLD